MSPEELRRETGEALQRLNTGIDLLNLLLLDRVTRHDAAAWAAFQHATVLRDATQLESAWADLERYYENLRLLAGKAAVAANAAAPLGIQENADPLMEYLRGLDALREALRDAAQHPAIPARLAEVEAARSALSTPNARRDALDALEMRARTGFHL
ncbi:MAG: hypothetical protein ACYCW6_04775 [Candidatus Xenobia bacterium]